MTLDEWINIKQFQSTLPRRERQRQRNPCHTALQISIHAPTKGATAMQMAQGKSEDISIHAPTKGATLMPGIMEVQYRFQSTLPRRERLGGVIVMMKYIPISIHAPTKGATNRSTRKCYKVDISIHAPTKGATCLQDVAWWDNPHFNPRSHEGSDLP